MRRSTMLALALVAASAAPAAAASIGPDSFGYVAKDAGYSFTDISSSGTASGLNSSDDGTVSVDLSGSGFSFDFYGTSYSTVNWSPNGMITFGGTDGDPNNVDTSTSAPGGDLASIMVFWDDLEFTTSGAGDVYYQLFGSGSSQYLVVQWDTVFHYFASSSTGTLQAVLFEGTNTILFSYADLNFGDATNYDYGVSATVGIRDSGGESNGYNLLWSFDTASLSDSQSIVFSVVPEPGTIALYGLGLAGLGVLAARRRRRRRSR